MAISPFSTTDYSFNANISLPANAALGIFSAQAYSTSYGTGGDDTAAIQAALNAAISAGGAVAFLPPPSSGKLNISSTLLLGSNGASLVGAAPGVTIAVIAGSNLDWAVATGIETSVDYRTNFVVNTHPVTLGGNTYNLYNAASMATGLASGGGIYNVTFKGDSTQTTGLGIGCMLNAARNFVFSGTNWSGFIFEDISLWDCFNTTIFVFGSTSTGPSIGVHRACYETSLIACSSTAATQTPYRVYCEQYTSASVTTTYSPMFTKFVDCHAYCPTTQAEAYDLQGAVYVNLTGSTGDNVTSVYTAATRYSLPCYQVLSDSSGSSITLPLSIANGGTGSATQNFVDLSSNQTINGTKTFGTEVVINGSANQAPVSPVYVYTANSGIMYAAYEFGLGVPGATGNWNFQGDSSFTADGAAIGTNGVPGIANMFSLYVNGNGVAATHKFDSSGNFTALGQVRSTTPIAASSGGTGLATPGSSGNVLTSNGSTWTSAAPSGSSLPTPRQSSFTYPTGSAGTASLSNTATVGNTILFYGTNTSGSISAATGWTQLGNANGCFVFYKTAAGTSADSFAYSGFTGLGTIVEFSSAGTPYGYSTTNSGIYSFQAPILTTTGAAMVIAFMNISQGAAYFGTPGWSLFAQNGSDFGTSRSILLGWTTVSGIKDVSFSCVNDDPNNRYVCQFAIP